MMNMYGDTLLDTRSELIALSLLLWIRLWPVSLFPGETESQIHLLSASQHFHASYEISDMIWDIVELVAAQRLRGGTADPIPSVGRYA